MQNDNLELFLEKLSVNLATIDKDLNRIYEFTTFSKTKIFINRLTLSNFFVYHIIKSNKEGYYFLKNRKKYYFERLSEKVFLKVDKNYLLDFKKRASKALLRALRLACSNKLINAYFLVVNTDMGLDFLIEYTRNKELWIISYLNNVIMKKSDYVELYNPKEISRIDQSTLYVLNFIFDEYESMGFQPMYLLLFPDEVLNNLNKNFSWIQEKYDTDGIHKNNNYWLGDSCDCLFFQDEDYYEKKEYSQIREFTENPSLMDNSNFSFDEDSKSFIYQNNKQEISFQLLSDYVIDEEMKQELLSDNRYHECHSNSIKLVLGMRINDKNKKSLVSGMLKVNEEEYFYHSWMEVEYEDKNTDVFDYNHNFIMNKEDYYKLLDAKVVNKTDSDLLLQLLTLIDSFELSLHPMILGYFSQELLRDLEKNKFLIKQKEAE